MSRKKIIHVATQAIAQNRKHGTFEPPLILREGKKRQRVHEIHILDHRGYPIAKFVYSPHKPLDCGARCWVETDCEVVPVLWSEGKMKEAA